MIVDFQAKKRDLYGWSLDYWVVKSIRGRIIPNTLRTMRINPLTLQPSIDATTRHPQLYTLIHRMQVIK